MTMVPIRLEGPLQAWGVWCIGDHRPTVDAPTKSGVLGLVACCLGITRSDGPALVALHASCRVHVRVDRRGTRLVDDQTVQGLDAVAMADGYGRASPTRQTIQSKRTYLADASFVALVDSIREHGILETLVVSSDGYILSGHRRHAAACQLSLDRIPVRIRSDVSYARDRDTFLQLLASYNRQRTKTASEQFREEIVLMSDQPLVRIRHFRRGATTMACDGIVQLRQRKARCEIRDKLELRAAIIQVVETERKNWPLSDRAIHYRLLNIPGLVRNDKTRIPYENTPKSYDDVTNMLTRLRLDGSISFEAIADETRPVVVWDTHRSVGDFVRRELDGLL